MLPLTLTTQTYAWGIPAATESKVLSLARANGVQSAINPEDDTRFAELWVGTHPSGGASLGGPTPSDTPLETWLEQNPEALGATLAQIRQPGHNSGRLPYIMKVLSIDKPLPLQAHPTSDTAGGMHQQQPEMYPDASHKPEMAICLNSFCAFAGFLTFDKMSQQLGRVPQLAAVLGDKNVQDYLAAGPGPDNQLARHKALAGMVSQLLLHTPPELAQQTLDAVYKQQQSQADGSGAVLLPAGTQATQAAVDAGTPSFDSTSGGSSNTQTGPGSSSSAAAAGSSDAPAPKEPTTGTSSAEFTAEAEKLEGPTSGVCTACDLNLALGVVTQPGGLGQRAAMIAAAAAAWPGDAAGVLALLLLEDVVLERGQACLIPAGCPHAYVCGEILEVQAASNNTIKGGLTAHGEPTDKQGLVDIVTSGLMGGTSGHQGRQGGTLGDQPPGELHEGPPQLVEPLLPGSNAGSKGLGSVEGLQLYQPAVYEFQVWHAVVPAGHKGLDFVMDPGPGVLLVTGGAGVGVVKAGVVVSSALVDEAELHPGTALFIPAGSSLCFSGSSTTEALDFWMTTANSRMFSAAAAPAAAPEGAPLTPTGSDMRRGIAAATEGSADGQSGVHLTVKGVSSGVDTGHVFTASEQVAAAVMAGAAGSSCPANVKDAAAASAADGAAKLSLQGSGAAPMETD